MTTLQEKPALKFGLCYAGHPHWEEMMNNPEYRVRELHRMSMAHENEPGSNVAQELGCTCPTGGALDIPNLFAIDPECPLHNPSKP